MSQRELEAVIGRAILDQEFRMALFADRAAALAGYELTEAEVAALKLMDAESPDAYADNIGRRALSGPSAESIFYLLNWWSLETGSLHRPDRVKSAHEDSRSLCTPSLTISPGHW
jgi:hypothetical protein